MFKVYGDGTLLYEAPSFVRGSTNPVEINVDITGVSELRIVMLGIAAFDTGWPGMYDWEPMVCAANLTISK